MKDYLIIIITVFFFSCARTEKSCFDYFPAEPLAGNVVVFNAACSQNASNYTWSFGDGSADTTTNAIAINHVYRTPGIYIVEMKAGRKDGIVLIEGKSQTKMFVVR